VPGTPTTVALQEDWAEDFDITFPVVREPAGLAYSMMQLAPQYPGSIPYLVLLDRDMTIDSTYGAGQDALFEARVAELTAIPGPNASSSPVGITDVDVHDELCDIDDDTFLNFSCGGDDCDDTDPLIHPEAAEVCDDVDHNCDGRIHDAATDAIARHLDQDLDGYGDPFTELFTCEPLWPYVDNADDCDDTDELVNPDTLWYRDADNDGYGDPTNTMAACEQPLGYVSNGQDPDDSVPDTSGCWETVTVGRDHSCGLKTDGSIKCWGSDAVGQSSPPPGNDFVSVNSGYKHTCALRESGEVECWGASTAGATSPPADILFDSFTCGLNACCGLSGTEGDNAHCWGLNDDGQGDPPPGTFLQVSLGGGRHACGILNSGEMVCWGLASGFQGSPSPTAVLPGNYIDLSAAHYLTCGVLVDGTGQCWGSDKYAQASPPGLVYETIRSGTVHSCGITETSEIECWGSESLNRCDHPDGGFTSIDVNQLHSCAVTVDSLIQCWGEATEGKTIPASCAP